MVFPGRLGTANFRANFVTDRVVPACPSQICEGSQNTHRNVTERNMMGDFAWLLSLPVAGITATLARAILADLKLNFGCGQALPKGREQFYAQCPFFDNDLSRSKRSCAGPILRCDQGFAIPVKRLAVWRSSDFRRKDQREFRAGVTGWRSAIKEVAMLIIGTLTRGYDLKIGDRLEYYAPLLLDTKGNRSWVTSGARCRHVPSRRPFHWHENFHGKYSRA